VQDPATVYKDVEFARIDHGFQDALKRKYRTASEKSFEDCECDDCKNKVWRPLGKALETNITQPTETINSPQTIVQSPATPHPPTLSIIPRVTSIADAICQWEDGTVKRITDPYRKTAHWHIFKNTVSKRKVRTDLNKYI